jgi:hypothetical protein
MQNENGKRPIEDYELLIGLAKEADVIADRAEAVASRNQDLAADIVKAAKDTNALAKEARFNAVQAWDKAKKATPEGVKIEQEAIDPADEEAIIKAEQAAMDAHPEPEQDGSTELAGWPDDGSNPANAEFEELLQRRVLRLRGTPPGSRMEQIVDAGPCGQRNDIFENKELFKRVTPRFFFNGDYKQWRRNAPGGWVAPEAA